MIMGHLSIMTIACCACFFTVLGILWVWGYDVVKRRSPENLPKFYLVLAVVRILAVLTLAGVYILFISRSAGQSKAFALMVGAMYVAMMAITLKIKH